MNEKLQDIQEENYIIGIYFVLLFIYLYANTVEVEYIKNNDNNAKEIYRKLLFIVFGISFIITLYYSIENIKDLRKFENTETHKLKEFSTLANIFILIATVIYIYIIYKDEDINLEVSP